MQDAGVIAHQAGEHRTEVLCLKATHASDDHLTLKLYQPGQVYLVPDWLADIFIREGWGRLAADPAPVGPSETKVIEPVAFKRGKQARRR